jgi:16S rRNA (adenine1518-N6/adenine1519-N6)-dimethyltransferase
MADAPEQKSPKALLERFGLRPKRSFGQNFLCDVNLATRIAELAAPEPDVGVIEIGSGLGALTSLLVERARCVVAIERDRDLVPALEELFSEPIASGRMRLLEADAKQVDFLGELAGFDDGKRVISGNLPYQITGPLLEKVVHIGRRIRRGVFLVQREVAERLAAAPGTEDYGALTVFVQAQFRVERAFIVRRGAFYPQPGVDSAVVVFDPHVEPISEETPAFRRVVKSAFAARRKTLRNAWRALGSTEEVSRAAELAGVNLDARGETLSVQQFAAFARALPAGAEQVEVEDDEDASS